MILLSVISFFLSLSLIYCGSDFTGERLDPGLAALSSESFLFA